jgi:methylmalonyl-CoA epimerase
MIRGLKRVSLAVKDLAGPLAFYRDALGLQAEPEMELQDRGLRLVRLHAGAADIELLQPTGAQGTVASFIENRGEGPYHIAIEVDDLEQELATLLSRGVELIDREPRAGPAGPIAFVHPRSTGGVLVELCEAPRLMPEGQTAKDTLPEGGQA